MLRLEYGPLKLKPVFSNSFKLQVSLREFKCRSIILRPSVLCYDDTVLLNPVNHYLNNFINFGSLIGFGKYYWVDQTKEGEKGAICVVDTRNRHEVSVGKCEGKKQMGDIGLDGKIIFRSTLKKLVVGLYIGRD